MDVILLTHPKYVYVFVWGQRLRWLYHGGLSIEIAISKFTNES